LAGPKQIVKERASKAAIRADPISSITMPLLAAYTPDRWEGSHTDEIVQRVL